MKACFFSILIVIVSYSCEYQKKHNKLDSKKDIVKVDLNAKMEGNLPFDTLIKSKDLALAIAEPILFNVFGKKDIESKLPYHCELIDSNWHVWVEPTAPKGTVVFGGAHGIIMRAKNGEIISLIRTK